MFWLGCLQVKRMSPFKVPERPAMETKNRKPCFCDWVHYGSVGTRALGKDVAYNANVRHWPHHSPSHGSLLIL